MPTPNPRTPICIARGNLADLQASLADLSEGEICYAFDENAQYIVKDGQLVRINVPIPEGNEYDLLQYLNGRWIGKNVVNGGNF